MRRDADNPLGYFDRELTKRKEIEEVFDFKREDMSQRRLAERLDGRKIGKHLGVPNAVFESFTFLSEEVIEMIFVSMGMEKKDAKHLVASSFGASTQARLD